MLIFSSILIYLNLAEQFWIIPSLKILSYLNLESTEILNDLNLTEKYWFLVTF